MSLPITAARPLNVETNPILIGSCWAKAGRGHNRDSAVAPKSARFIVATPPDWKRRRNPKRLIRGSKAPLRRCLAMLRRHIPRDTREPAMIVTVTMNPAIDISTSVAEVAPYRKLRCTPIRRDPGGGGILDFYSLIATR